MTTDEIMKLVDEYAERAFVQGLRRAKKLEGLEETRASLLKAVEKIAADAARYRWLRVCENDNTVIYGDTSHVELMMEEVLDAAIDAAMKGETP